MNAFNSAPQESLDPRRRNRRIRRGAAGTATTMRFDGAIAGLRNLLAQLLATLERR